MKSTFFTDIFIRQTAGYLIAAILIATAFIAGPALAASPQATPEAAFENQVRQIVSEEVNKAFEKYSQGARNALKPEELTNVLIPRITEQVVKRSLPLIIGSGTPQAAAVSSDDALVLLEINDQKITVEDAIAEYSRLPLRSRTLFSSEERLRQFLNDVVLVNRLVLMEAARKKLFDRDEVKAQIEKAYENLLIETYYNQKKDEIAKKLTVTPDEIHSFYEENKEIRFQIKDCVKLANIFVKFQPGDSESVQLARSKIEKAKVELGMGTSFEQVWDKYSDDREHKNGVIGIFKRDRYDKNSVISEAFSRNRGEYTNIIKGNNGYYILKVLEKNDSKTIPLTEAKVMIEGELKVKKENDALTAWFKSLKTRYNIKIYKEKIGGTPDTIEVGAASPSLLSKAVATEETKISSAPGDGVSMLDAPPDAPSAATSDKVAEPSAAADTKAGDKDRGKDAGGDKKPASKKNGAKKEKKSNGKKSQQRDKSSEKPAAKPESSAKIANLTARTKDDLNEVLADVEGVAITRLMYNESISQHPAGVGKDFNKLSERLEVIDRLINRIVLKKEAQLAQIQNDPAFKREMKNIENKILARALIFEEVRKKLEPSKEEVKTYHDRNNREFRARHILIAVKNSGDKNEVESARAKAMLVYKKLATDDFEQTARTFSDDVSKNDGGLLPTFTYDDMVDQFSDAVKALKPGEISRPVLTSFGFHIIRLESSEAIPFSEARIKEKLIPQIQKKLLLKYIDSLKATYNYSFNEKNIKYAVDNKLFQR